MPLLALISGLLAGLYGLVNALAGFSQVKEKKIQPWSAWGMLGSGLLIFASGVCLAMRLPVALIILPIGLLAIHLLTINNGLRLYGKINPGHHLLRLAVSLILFGLAFWSLQ